MYACGTRLAAPSKKKGQKKGRLSVNQYIKMYVFGMNTVVNSGAVLYTAVLCVHR